MLRWERDQNDAKCFAVKVENLPQCSGGSEIKTCVAFVLRRGLAYHSAPVGARSKQKHAFAANVNDLTTVLRWERDQNVPVGLCGAGTVLPQCSGGSEIKTLSARRRSPATTYHSAPVGARSKRAFDAQRDPDALTTVLRWERDQNNGPFVDPPPHSLPQCSGGSEIKTWWLRCCGAGAPYHSAPVGARSKPGVCAANLSAGLTTVLRWERDQNLMFLMVVQCSSLPQCSGGSEIKT